MDIKQNYSTENNFDGLQGTKLEESKYGLKNEKQIIGKLFSQTEKKRV